MKQLGWRIGAELFQGPGWETWPFGPDWGNLWASAARILFVALILGAIALFLRKLYGPGGWFRDKELEKEARLAKEQALQELAAQLERGEIDEALYRVKKRSIEREGP
ncbi:MAG: hypothetical protein PWQ57_2856 [Desulfovibrionales bacterium]|nr:hypothetical protein [Desulfovibrionales bacterium]